MHAKVTHVDICASRARDLCVGDLRVFMKYWNINCAAYRMFFGDLRN